MWVKITESYFPGVTLNKKTPKTTSPFGKLMTRLRKKQGLTMSALAQAVNVSESYISLLESGVRKQPSRELVLKLAYTLGARSNNSLTDDFLVTAGYYPSNKYNYTSHAETLNVYQTQYQKDPSDFNSFSALIMALIKMGETQSAQDMIHQGLGHFEHSLQLQSLLASLELAKQNYSQALSLQSFVIQQYLAVNEREPETLKRLQINLGIMHFFYGLHHEQQGRKAWIQKKTDLSEKAKTAAESHLTSAYEIFADLLESHSEDIYLLDEFARVSFNLAQISDEQGQPKSRQLWQACLVHLQKVLHAEQKYSLGREVLLETSLSLVHVYSKLNLCEQAETLINVLEITVTPVNWRVLYAKACFYTQRFLSKNRNQDLNLALQYLQQANRLEPTLVRQSALLSPDLSTLRAEKTMEFRRIFL